MAVPNQTKPKRTSAVDHYDCLDWTILDLKMKGIQCHILTFAVSRI